MKKGFVFLILFLICAFMTSCVKPSGNLAESSLPALQGTDNMESTLEEESWAAYSHDGVSYEITAGVRRRVPCLQGRRKVCFIYDNSVSQHD